MEELAEQLAGRCAGRRLYFASCSVLRAPEAVLQRFLQTTGAALVCGYSRNADWVESSAYETVLLDVLANGSRHNAAEQRIGSTRWAPLAAYLGFRVIYVNGTRWLAE